MSDLRASILACTLLFGCVHGIANAQVIATNKRQEEWVQLFNSHDLEGWMPKIAGHPLGENFADTFRVENGLLEVRYDRYASFDRQFGHLFYERPFSYYRLAIEYRFVGEQARGGPGSWAIRNSGVMLHSQDPRTMTRDQTFPIAIEAQFLGGLSDGKPRPTLNVCTPGTEIVYDGQVYPEHCLSSSSRTLDGDQWIRAEMIVLGAAQITHRVNGQNVLQYALPQFGGGDVEHHDPAAKPDGQLIEGGYIALQSESHPLDVRKVELLNLAGCMDRSAVNYKPYYVKAELAACKYSATTAPAARRVEWTPLFNGRDLEGWRHVGAGRFIVKDGELHTEGGMGLLWYTREKLCDAVLRIVYRTLNAKAGGNSGVFIRIPEQPTEPWMPVNRGYEVQIDDTADDFHRTGTLYSFTKAKGARQPREWNTMEITLEAKRTRVSVNGISITDYREGEPVPPKRATYEPDRGARSPSGYIGLQNHGTQDVVVFREISVRKLK